MEIYNGPPNLRFEMPVVRLVTMEPNKGKLNAIKYPLWRRVVSWALATRNRKFVLDSEFRVEVSEFSDDRLNGEIVVPSQLDQKNIEFDGASIPLPWLVAAISGNALRPLGSVLIPSIVHDYLFKSGEVEVSLKRQEVDRDTADKLFLDMFRSISGLRFIPWVAWVAVRAGAFLTRYNGKRGGITRGLIFVGVALLILMLVLSVVSTFALVTVLFLFFGVWFIDWFFGIIASKYQADR